MPFWSLKEGGERERETSLCVKAARAGMRFIDCMRSTQWRQGSCTPNKCNKQKGEKKARNANKPKHTTAATLHFYFISENHAPLRLPFSRPKAHGFCSSAPPSEPHVCYLARLAGMLCLVPLLCMLRLRLQPMQHLVCCTTNKTNLPPPLLGCCKVATSRWFSPSPQQPPERGAR